MSLDVDHDRQQALAWRRYRPHPPTVTLDVPWRSAPETMDLESQAAFGVARQWWPGLLAERRHGDRRRRTRLVSPKPHRRSTLRFQLSGAGAQRDGGPPFRGRVAVDVPDPAAWAVGGRAWARGVLAIAADSIGVAAARPTAAARPDERLRLRSAIAFATLEQLVGWPTLQGALRVLSEATVQRSMTRQDVEQVIASAVGRDLSWFFRVAFDDSASVDYAIGELTTGEASPCGDGPCFRTRVTVVRERRRASSPAAPRTPRPRSRPVTRSSFASTLPTVST